MQRRYSNRYRILCDCRTHTIEFEVNLRDHASRLENSDGNETSGLWEEYEMMCCGVAKRSKFLGGYRPINAVPSPIYLILAESTFVSAPPLFDSTRRLVFISSHRATCKVLQAIPPPAII